MRLSAIPTSTLKLNVYASTMLEMGALKEKEGAYICNLTCLDLYYPEAKVKGE